jgi:hypothetical protein
MVVVAPPKPPEHHEDLEALIEEARRRTRRRRLMYAAAAAGALAAGAVSYVIVSLTAGGGPATGLPAGFHAVQARGAVQHLRVDYSTRPPRTESIQLAGGEARPATLSQEVWYDRASRYYRVVGVLDGRVLFDLVGRTSCYPTSGPNRFCIPPGPFVDVKAAPHWPLDPKMGRETRTGSFRGHKVIWVESLANGRPVSVNGEERWGLDARTHEVLVRRTLARIPGQGQFREDEAFTRLKDVPARNITFAVPEGGAPDHGFPPQLELATSSRASSLSGVRKTLGTVPLWLGPRFRGHRLVRAEVGTEGIRAKTGRVLLHVPFVSFDYGIVKLQEYGPHRSFRVLNGPPGGRIFFYNGAEVDVTRDKLLIVARLGDKSFRLDRAAALALTKALRPLSPEA